ncbi:hypothetical protein FAZ15_17135 [Sphingobacterium olei]|uniref:Uncharacterized protein n=1 Tax=Sphingobacterium olei TaxID=2571155 RepID=A0A4U0NHR3_9SPHI|nr:hypothetical protein [Sphingobacterium olei]TJZ53749.1 hypothetical protein FAZ15_17135 [Sphingobacterium olei]
MKCTYLLVFLWLVASCGMQKTTVQREQTNAALSESTWWTAEDRQQQVTDSARRMWSFYADSVFYFHPDSGLSAYNGWVQYQDGRSRGSTYSHRVGVVDALTETQVQSTAWTWRKWVSNLSHWPWMLAVLLLIAYLGYRYRAR